MKKFYKVLVVSLLAGPALAGSPGPAPRLLVTPGAETTLYERKRTILKVYDVGSKEQLAIDNQFGQVRVAVWNKDEIRVQITITAKASSSEERAQRYLDAVNIIEKRAGEQISLKTDISSAGNNWSNQKGDENFIRIDYDVSMPRTNALSVRNRFGNTDIAAFQAPLTVYQRYGNFSANELSGSANDIDVAYGSALIRQLEQGKLDIAYSSLDLERANVVTLVNKFGKLKIGEVGKLDAQIGYSGARIGTLRESAKIKLDFSGGFRIEQFGKSADDVTIKASYSSVTLPVSAEADCNFDVTVSYGGFHYPNINNISFTAQPSDEPRSGPKNTKQYAGKIGRGTGPKIRVVSTYGSVSFK